MKQAVQVDVTREEHQKGRPHYQDGESSKGSAVVARDLDSLPTEEEERDERRDHEEQLEDDE